MTLDWAHTQTNIGLAFEAWAGLVPADAPRHLQTALAAFDAALTVFDPEHSGFYFDKCTAARARVAEKLAALPDGGTPGPLPNAG